MDVIAIADTAKSKPFSLESADDARAKYLAGEALANKNPLIPFMLTYKVHDELDRLGVFTKTFGNRGGRWCNRGLLQYRVLHTSVRGSKAFVTKNTWRYGEHVPHMEEIEWAGDVRRFTHDA